MKLSKTNIAFLLVPALLLAATGCFSQGRLQEEICVHVDRNYFLAGDELHYVVYCTEKSTGKPSRISTQAELEILNSEGEILTREKIRLHKGKAWGSLRIPADSDSDDHVLRCYTSWMRNFGPHIFHYTPLLIINPNLKYTNREEGEKFQGQTPEREISTPDLSGPIKIGGLKKIYSPGDSIKFRLLPGPGANTEQTASLSLSIVRSESLYPGTFSSPELPGEYASQSIARNTLRYLPSMQGIHITGKVEQSGSKKPLVNRNVLLSFIDSVAEIKAVKTDSSGRFLFDLNGIHGKKDMIVQVPGENDNIIITLDPSHSPEAIPDYVWVNLFREDLPGLFREMLLEQQIAKTYFPEARQADKTTCTKPPLPFYGKSDHEIIMEDFVRLPLMEEVFRELGKRVFLVRTRESFKVLLLDLETNRIIGQQPWYFLDGIPFFDSEKLLSIDPAEVRSISLKSRKYFVGELVMDGIIDIRTNKGDASIIDLPRSAVRQYFQGFPEIPPGSLPPGNLDQEKIPLYKTSLLFEPLIELNSASVSSISLIAPDSKGHYTISVRGINSVGMAIQQDFSFLVN